MIGKTHGTTLQELMAKAEEQILRDALDTWGSIHVAADHLGIHRNTLSRKLIKFGITEDELFCYRHKRGLAKFGTGWSGHGRRKLPTM
jgi:hypothetical protein